jgi:hypothetical protein
MKERSMGVVISSTEEGVGSSCEITSCALTRETVAASSKNVKGNTGIKNRAKIALGSCGSNKETSSRFRILCSLIAFLPCV